MSAGQLSSLPINLAETGEWTDTNYVHGMERLL
ncbi:hypothetical protein BH09ACT7_BH09ACT7_10580 [soil metagenome]